MFFIPPAPVAAPLITEVLYAVPQKEAGDATQDGKRHATGDEFVELCNTTGKPLDLKGWALVDSDSWAFLTEKGKKPLAAGTYKADGKDWLFVFPACTLQPGQCAVVFNGFEQSPPGPVGTPDAAAAKNEKFGGSLVFKMKVETAKVGFGNDGDWVGLVSPDGQFVQIVKWGKPDHAPPASGLVADAPADAKGSVQRESVTADAKFVDHVTVGKKDRFFSPGEPPAGAKSGDAPVPKAPEQKPSVPAPRR